MFHIYIYTPPYNNSDYISHIIEHCVLGKITEDIFFENELIEAGSSTYYSYYILDTNSKNKLNKIINNLTLEIPKETIKYEHPVIKKEVNDNNYSQKLTCKIGKKLYGKTYKYAKSGKKIYSTIQEYHKKYYSKNNIIILENNTKYYTENININLNIYKKEKIKIGKDNENAYIFKHGICELYIIGLLSELLDYYIKYKLRYTEQEYDIQRYETIYGDFKDYIYLSIPPKIIDKIKSINLNFISSYIKYSNSKNLYLKDKDFDGSSIVKYGYTLSNNQKKEILKNIGNYYKKFINQL